VPRIAIIRILAKVWVAAWLAVSLAAAAAQSVGTAPATPAPAGAGTLSALRAGGYILYFRHTATDFGQNDEKMTGYEDCATQRNLTDGGRADARAIGAAIRSLGIPIGDVLASPFCRTRETAELIFGRATVTSAVRGGPASAEAGRYAELTLLFARRPLSGANLAIASHGNPFVAVAGGPYLAEGEAAVIEPLGNAGFRIVARVRKDEWATLK
jgi:hypothetical protein